MAKHSERRPHVTVFCGFQPKGKHEKTYRALAVRFGELLARENFVCVNGGTGGMMDDISEGAIKAGGAVHAIALKTEQVKRLSPFFTKREIHDRLTKRQARLLEVGDAFVALPGGIGTTYEIFEVLCKKSIGELGDKPMIVVGPYFSPLKAWLKTIMKEGFAWTDIFAKITFVADEKAAIRVLKKHFTKASS